MEPTQTPHSPTSPVTSQPNPLPDQPHTRGKRHLIRYYLKTHWKELLLAVVFAIAASIMIYTLIFQTIFTTRRYVNIGKRDDTTYSPLSGLETTKELAARPVTGIM